MTETRTYFLHSPSTNAVKIGRSRNFKSRLKSLTTGTADELVLLGTLEGDRELELHHQFADCRVRGEWFSVTPALADFLKAQFQCVLAERKRVGVNTAPVESWTDVINRAEHVFGHGLRHTDYDGFCEEMLTLGYDFDDRSDDEKKEDGDNEMECGFDGIIFGLEGWWPWVKGWNLFRPESGLPQLALLLQKPDNAPKIQALCGALADWGDLSEQWPEIDVRVAICWRQRTEANEWIGEIIGPVLLTDGPSLMSSICGGVSTAFLMDEEFEFKLLGDAYYRRLDLPTPAESGLVPV